MTNSQPEDRLTRGHLHFTAMQNQQPFQLRLLAITKRFIQRWMWVPV